MIEPVIDLKKRTEHWLQIAASDPHRLFCFSKCRHMQTQVLTMRVLSLLLTGVPKKQFYVIQKPQLLK